MIIKKDLSGSLNEFTPLDTTFKASISNPESVSSIIIKLGSSNAICNISFLFFSPPEKPTFKGRASISSSIFSSVDFSLRIFKNSIAFSSDSPLAFLMEFREVLKKFLVNTPGISVGYCKAKKTPS